MSNYKKNISAIIIFLLFAVGCKKDMDKKPPIPPTPKPDSAVNTVMPDTIMEKSKPILNSGITIFVINHEQQVNFRYANDSTLTAATNSAILLIDIKNEKQLQKLAEDINVGDFITAGQEANLPSGLLAKITAKKKIANGISFSFLNAGLESLFSFLDINWNFNFSKDYLLNRVFSKSIPVSDGVDLSFTGGYSFDLGNQLNIQIQHSQLNLCSYEIDANALASLNAAVTGEFSLDKSYSLYELPSITKTALIPIGPVAIPLVLTLNSEVNFNVKAAGNFELRGQIMGASNQTTLNFNYTNANGAQTNGNTKNVLSFLNPSTFESTLSGSIETGIFLDETLNFYKSKILGLHAGVGVYNVLTGDCIDTTGLNIKDSIGAKAYIGGTIDLFVSEPYHSQFDIPIYGKQVLNTIISNSNFCSQPIDPTVDDAGSSGDVHFVTFNGHHYDFQAAGEFVALSTDYLQVQCRQQPLPNFTSRIVTLNTALAIQTGNDNISFQVSPMKFYVNHAVMTLTQPIKLSSGGSVSFGENQIFVQCFTGDKIIITYYPSIGYLDYKISLIQKHKNKVSGIIGDWNDDAVNDVQIKNGSFINANDFSQLYPVYANSWRITDQTSLFVYDAAKSTKSYTDLNYPYQPATFTSVQLNQALTACQQAGVTTNPALCNCAFDVGVTGSTDFTKSAVNYQSNFSADNLVAYFPFDGDAKDHSNYSNHDTISGDYTYTVDRNGKANKALSINTNNPNGEGFASIPNNAFVMPLTSQITIAAWVNVKQWYNNFGLITCKSLRESSQLQFYFTPTGIFSDGGRAYAKTPSTLQTNTWYHFALVVNGTQRSFYLNGVKIGDATGPLIQPNSSPLDIGRDVYGATEYLIGSIDEVRIYSKALNDNDVKNLAQ